MVERRRLADTTTGRRVRGHHMPERPWSLIIRGCFGRTSVICVDRYEASVWHVPDPTGRNKRLVVKIQKG